LPRVLYGRETWFLALREKLRVKMLENMLCVKICVGKRWMDRRDDLHCTPNEGERLMEHAAQMGVNTNILGDFGAGKAPFGGRG